jgi:hypothetical protein
VNCPHCGAPLSAAERLCPVCFRPTRRSSPGPGIGGGQGSSTATPGSGGGVLSRAFGDIVTYDDVLVLSFDDDGTMPKPQVPGIAKVLIAIGVAAVLLLIFGSMVKSMLVNLGYFIFITVGLVLALKFMLGGNADGLITNMLTLPFKMLMSLISGAAGAAFNAGRNSGGPFGQADHDRIPVKNLVISTLAEKRVIRIEGRLSVGSIKPDDRIDVTAKHNSSTGGLLFLKGFNRTLNTVLLVSKN